MKYTCPNCGVDDERYFGYLNDQIYCRRCLAFQKNKPIDSINRVIPTTPSVILKYPLSTKQSLISSSLSNDIDKYDNILLYAVCGAGKTEIIVKSIEKFLKEGKLVGIVIPRRDLVIELGKRIKDIFVKNKVSLVYGGHHDDLLGEIVIMTAHQAFRFKDYFDLLIIDEIDAFPYKGNDLLINMVRRASKGKIISLSATPSEEDLKANHVYKLFSRYHNNPLPVPKIIYFFKLGLLKIMVRKCQEYLRKGKSVFVYVPSIKEGYKLFNYLIQYFQTTFIYSSLLNKDKVIEEIRERKYKVIITTTILERGVTFKDLQVIVFLANKKIFDKATLIQIAGRVGRVIDAPSGDILFLANGYSKEMHLAVKEIKSYNVL